MSALDPTVERILAGVKPEWYERAETRRELGRNDPLMFALIYLPTALKDPNGYMSFADCHFEWAELAKRWRIPPTFVAEHRYALLAPRATGKSTWWFKIFPIWWAAYGYTKFIAAFAHNADMAERHLNSFKLALTDERHKFLKHDFPELVTEAKSTKDTYIAKSGFVFMAKGVDNQALGMKHGDTRPDTLLLDDIEPDETSYSMYQMEGRLRTLQDAILPLETWARVVISGTVTMPGSITHQMVKYAKGYNDPSLEWVKLQNIQVLHSRPIIVDEDGSERSFWPGNPKFQLEGPTGMLATRHTREFKKNYENDPMAVDSEYWLAEDFEYKTFECVNTMLSIDGAVTTGQKSDYTGLVVLGKSGGKKPNILVKHAVAVKLRGEPLRAKVMQILEMYPEINGILVESNQGGEMWLETLHNLPVPILTIHNKDKKETRAGRALTFYQVNPKRVFHVSPLTNLEEQMMAFPQVPNDDLVDACVNGILKYMRPDKPAVAGARVRRPR